jgi:hypothetical protein
MCTSWARPKASFAIGLIDLASQRGLGMAGIEAHHRQPELLEFMPVPGRELPRLEPDLHCLRGLCNG